MESIRTPHPYFPENLVLDHYVPNTNSVFLTLSYVSITFIFITLVTIALGYPKRHSCLSSIGDRLAFFWFILCVFLHIFFEGYFGLYHKTLAGDNSPVAQVWKEYALSDSRYLSSDTFVLIAELVTIIIWGPLALFNAWSTYHNLPSRHIGQLILSLGQVYSCTLYYFTSIVEGSPECRPEPYYYYFYFWFFNAFWMVAPVILIKNSIKTLYNAMAQL
ncbi:hypothetical protein BX616_000611 [Lobosporangium transversale]|nr:hypothetical protein BX616_000611 [Lobosporangium transversale]